MRSRRAASFLVLVILLAAAWTLLRPAPPVRAAEPAVESIPPVCRETLPLPSEYEFRKSEYELTIGRFMKAECFKHLGWPHDVQIRPSGPTIATLGTSTSDPHLPAWVSQSWAVHGSVLVYYMLVSRGVAPLATTYNSMIQQADNETATVAVQKVEKGEDQLTVDVEVRNLAGHKLPSGVGFRRLFVELSVLDASGQPIWVSGRTSPTGVIVNENNQPVKGEFLWKSDCQPMTAAEQKNWYQPHYTNITRQDQVQIYQELVRDPRGKLTTSFLAIAQDLKDNRLLPRGWDPSVERAQKEGLGSPKLSAEALVHDILPKLPSGGGGQVTDPWYLPKSQGGLGGGGDALTYTIPLSDLKGRQPATVQARLFYQSIPPYYLQDRFCTAPEKPDTSRLFFLTGHLDLSGTRAESWKLLVVSSGAVAVPGNGAS